MVRKNRTTNAIRGLNEADLIVGAVGIAAGIAAFFTGGTSIAAYAAFVADIAGVMGSAGGIASGSLQVQQGKTTGNKKEVREGIESIGFGIGGLASMGMGYASTKYFSGNPWLRSAIRGASAALDVGMMATGTALTIKSDVTGNGGIGLKASNWQGDLALAESVMGIGMFGVQSYNAYNEYSIQVKANTGISDAPIGVMSRSDSEILKTSQAKIEQSTNKLAQYNIPETDDSFLPSTRRDRQDVEPKFIASAKTARAENNNFDASQLEIMDYTITSKEECPRLVIRVRYKGQEYYFYRSSGGAGKKYVGEGYYVTGGKDISSRLIKISDTLTKAEMNTLFPSFNRSKNPGLNDENLETYFYEQGKKEEELYMSRQGDIRLFQNIAKYLNERFM